MRALYDLKWTPASPASRRIRIDVLARDHTEQAVRAPWAPHPPRTRHPSPLGPAPAKRARVRAGGAR